MPVAAREVFRFGTFTADGTARALSYAGTVSDDDLAVADEVHLSVETVRSHLRSAFQKLGASGRTQAAVMAVCQGLVSWHLEELS